MSSAIDLCGGGTGATQVLSVLEKLSAERALRDSIDAIDNPPTMTATVAKEDFSDDFAAYSDYTDEEEEDADAEYDSEDEGEEEEEEEVDNRDNIIVVT
jgi:hypothetical protein